MTTERMVGPGVGRFFGTLLLVIPALAVGLAGAVALHSRPDGVERLLPWGALVAVLCTYVLLGRLRAGTLGESVLAVALAAYLMMLPVGYVIGESWLGACPGVGYDCDLGAFYGGIGALAALGVVPIVIVVVEAWRARRPG